MNTQSRDPGFQIPRPGSNTKEPALCLTADPPLGPHPDAPIWRLSGHRSVASGMDFIGHVAARAVVWRPCGWAGPGTEWEAQRSGLFGARPQAAGERAEEEVLLAGSGELGQALLLLLGLGNRRRRGGSAGVGRASSQGSQFPALGPGEISAQPKPFPPKSQNTAQTWQEPVLSHRSPDSNPHTLKIPFPRSQGASPLNPGNLFTPT